LRGHFGQALVELLQDPPLNQHSSADQCGVVRNLVEIHPTELAQDQAVSHLMFRLIKAQAIYAFDSHHAQDHFDKGRVPPGSLSLWKALG
jgi:hypothetical protein